MPPPSLWLVVNGGDRVRGAGGFKKSSKARESVPLASLDPDDLVFLAEVSTRQETGSQGPVSGAPHPPPAS